MIPFRRHNIQATDGQSVYQYICPQINVISFNIHQMNIGINMRHNQHIKDYYLHKLRRSMEIQTARLHVLYLNNRMDLAYKVIGSMYIPS